MKFREYLSLNESKNQEGKTMINAALDKWFEKLN